MQKQPPKSWKAITLDQYLDFTSLNPQEYSYNEDYVCDCISILCDIDLEEIERMKFSDFVLLQKTISFTEKPPGTDHSKNQIGEYHLRPFNQITLGEFIDLEYYISNNDNIPVMLSILFKQKKLDRWGNEVFEPYKYQPADRADFFRKQPVSDVWGIMPAYMEFRNKILEDYKELFSPSEKEDEEDLSKLTGQEKRQIEREIEQEKRIAKFSWERFIFSLCNEDLTKFEAMTEMKLILVLNMVSMQKISK